MRATARRRAHLLPLTCRPRRGTAAPHTREVLAHVLGRGAGVRQPVCMPSMARLEIVGDGNLKKMKMNQGLGLSIKVCSLFCGMYGAARVAVDEHCIKGGSQNSLDSMTRIGLGSGARLRGGPCACAQRLAVAHVCCH